MVDVQNLTGSIIFPGETMQRYYFSKLASPEGVPFWISVPGTPFTLPGSPKKYERLPGMTQWAPRSMIERMAAGLENKVPAEQLTKEEEGRGAGGASSAGALMGGTGGALLGRLIGGEKATQPFLDIARKGLNKGTFSKLRHVPKAMKAMPLLGAGAGAMGGYLSWLKGKPQRKETADQVAKGLLTEEVLQKSNILNAANTVNNNDSALSRIKPESAHHAAPYLATSGNMGV